MQTNSHVHLFSADHAPSAQVYYLLRGALHGAARQLLPAVIGREVNTDDLRQLDRSLDRFEWPWPMLFNAAVGASALAGGIGLISPKRLINMFTTVGRLSREECRKVFRVDKNERESDLLKGLIERKNAAAKAGSLLPFRDAMCAFVSELYAQHERNARQVGRVTHREIYQAFMKSPGADQYRFLIALSVNFDEAFLDDVLPGLASSPTQDFEAQGKELTTLASEVNAVGNVQILPFLGVEPRGHDAASLLKYVTDRVGKDKPWKGLKFYPSMGILPTDDRLRGVFDFCQDRGIPIVTHCSVGGAGVRGSSRNFADLSNPLKWLDVLVRLARRGSSGMFRLCLAHFDSLEAPDNVSWCDEIIQLMQSFNGAQGVEVYSDIAFDVVVNKNARAIYAKNVKRVKALGLSNRVLFGSDWWNYLYECASESDFIKQLRIDDGWWTSADFKEAESRFLKDIL